MDADYSLLRDPDMKEIFDSFVVETKEIFDKLDLDLVELEKRPEDKDLLNDIFRSFHTIKGTSGFLGLIKLQNLTHRGEDILNKLRKGEARVNLFIMDAILKSYDSMRALLDVIESNLDESYDVSTIITTLDFIIESLEKDPSLLEGENAGAAPPLSADLPSAEEKKSAKKKSKKKKESAEEERHAERAIVPDTGVTEADITVIETIVEIEDADNDHDDHDEPVSVPIPGGASGPTIQSALTKTSPDAPTVRKGGDNTIRVDVERLDDLLNIVSELVLGRNRLTQIQTEVASDYEGTKLSRDLAETSRQIDLMTTELQLAVMKTRMIKIGKVFNKFPRMVRDLSKEIKKEIELEIFGEDTELDKTLIEEINDPLVHLIRNSIDHGIELPEERIAKGKPAKGTVKLSAEHEGNNIIIMIEDDGKGINVDVIRRKAVEKGLISEDRAKELTRQEVYNLLFLPGFSTAEKVTNISGRGVGMDVVKTNVTKLRGIINIESELNKGTRVIVKLPLTLAIIQGLLVRVFGETLVIPLSSVIEVVRISTNNIHSINQKEVIKLRETVLPLVDIGESLYPDLTNQEGREWQYVVVVGIAERRYGIKVDELIGQTEVVIKSLGTFLGTIEGIAGSTIMGDGKVVMILDLAELIAKM